MLSFHWWLEIAVAIYCCSLDTIGDHCFSKGRPRSRCWRKCGSCWSWANLYNWIYVLIWPKRWRLLLQFLYLLQWRKHSWMMSHIVSLLCPIMVCLGNKFPWSDPCISQENVCLNCLGHNVHLGHFCSAICKLLTTAFSNFFDFSLSNITSTTLVQRSTE